MVYVMLLARFGRLGENSVEKYKVGSLVCVGVGMMLGVYIILWVCSCIE